MSVLYGTNVIPPRDQGETLHSSVAPLIPELNRTSENGTDSVKQRFLREILTLNTSSDKI